MAQISQGHISQGIDTAGEIFRNEVSRYRRFKSPLSAFASTKRQKWGSKPGPNKLN